MTITVIAPLKFNSKHQPGRVLVERDGIALHSVIRCSRNTDPSVTHCFIAYVGSQWNIVFTGNSYKDMKERLIKYLSDLPPAIQGDAELTRQQFLLIANALKASSVQALQCRFHSPSPLLLDHLEDGKDKFDKDIDVAKDFQANPRPFPFGDALDGYKSLSQRNAEIREVIQPHLTPAEELTTPKRRNPSGRTY